MIELVVDLALAATLAVVSVRSHRQAKQLADKIESAKRRTDELHIRVSSRLANHISSKLHK